MELPKQPDLQAYCDNALGASRGHPQFCSHTEKKDENRCTINKNASTDPSRQKSTQAGACFYDVHRAPTPVPKGPFGAWKYCMSQLGGGAHGIPSTHVREARSVSERDLAYRNASGAGLGQGNRGDQSNISAGRTRGQINDEMANPSFLQFRGCPPPFPGYP